MPSPAGEILVGQIAAQRDLRGSRIGRDVVEIEKVYVVQVKKRIGSRRGVGGLFESMLAMMVITVGMLFLTYSISYFSSDIDAARSSSELQEKCLLLRDELLSNESLMIGESLIFSIISSVNPSCLESGRGFGAFISLTEFQGQMMNTAVLFNSSRAPSEIHFTAVLPLSVQHSSSDVRAALLTICVWE